MAKEQSADTSSLPSLTVSRAEATKKIEAQIGKGVKLRNTSFDRETTLEFAREERIRWGDYNKELLKRLFDSSSIAEEYSRSHGPGIIPLDPTFDWKVNEFRRHMDVDINRLQSVLSRLELIPELEARAVMSGTKERESYSDRDVFLVHGHDEEARQAVARLITKLDLNPVILLEQPNAGRTIIEKIEDGSDIVGYAVVLLTPDDVGYPKDKPDEKQLRARQNVLLELGYFMGKVGRSRVCALNKGVELPSDIHGVVYIEMDDAGGWKLQLAREMKEAGISIDLNKLA